LLNITNLLNYFKNKEEVLKYIRMEDQSTNKAKYDYIKAQQMYSDEKKKALEVIYINELLSL